MADFTMVKYDKPYMIIRGSPKRAHIGYYVFKEIGDTGSAMIRVAPEGEGVSYSTQQYAEDWIKSDRRKSDGQSPLKST